VDSVVGLAVALLPVTVFLVALVLIDSYKLIPLRWILRAILVGCAVAVLCSFANSALQRLANISWTQYTRYGSPIVEEALKSVFLVYLIRRRRIAFMVDALIYGFAIGAGFALIENAIAFTDLGDRLMIVWVVRGFGTAIMHGGVTAILGIVSQYFASRYGSNRYVVYFPGFFIAAGMHSFFNLFIVPAQYAPVMIIAVLSVIVAFTFRISERKTREWLGVRFDTDQELLELVNTGKSSESRIGEYLQSLQERFPGEVVVDMLCMLRIHLELSVRAKGMLLMREAGFRTERDAGVEERLTELKYLEKNIGRTGILAISPMLNMSDKELWQLHMVNEA
jgi:protease PrsW